MKREPNAACIKRLTILGVHYLSLLIRSFPIRYLVLIFLLLGCAKDNKSNQTDHVSEDFSAKYSIYKSLVLDVPSDNCDWLLFQSLRDASLKREGLVEQAEGDPGRWYRTPAHDCYPSRSKSDISRDMLLGLGFYLWQKGDIQNAQEILDYSDSHHGVMGDGDIFRTDIRNTLYNAYQAIVLRSEDSTQPLPPRTENPDPNSVDLGLSGSLDGVLVQTDFAAHLTVLSIYLRGLIYGGIGDFELSVLKKQSERIPRNALYQAVYHKFSDGNMEVALDGLLDEALFPKESLPTNANYCTEWLWQRDEGDNWKPCADVKTHTGADWLFAAEVVRNGFKEGSNP